MESTGGLSLLPLLLTPDPRLQRGPIVVMVLMVVNPH